LGVSSGVTPTARDPAATRDDTEARGLAWLALIAGVSGIATGILGAAFRVCLNHADALRSGINTWAHQWPLVGWVLPVAIAALLVGLASWLVQHFAPLAAGSGVQHVEAVMRGEAAPAPLIVLPIKFVGGVLAIGSGLVLGREGPTVQMGATLGARLAELVALDDARVRIMQSASAGAGLAVAFNTPLGGIAFVFEELVRRFSTQVMVATLAACGTAVIVARVLLGNDVDFVVAPLAPPTGGAVGGVSSSVSSWECSARHTTGPFFSPSPASRRYRASRRPGGPPRSVEVSGWSRGSNHVWSVAATPSYRRCSRPSPLSRCSVRPLQDERTPIVGITMSGISIAS
jgi:hypothetical protein